MTDMRQDRLALDRGASARSFDEDGHLHVRDVPISKAAVNGYYGREIPRGEEMGLEPNRLYQLLRDPEELKKAAETFNGKPLLNLHKPQTASDHDHELTVGAVHNVYFDAPYLKAGDFHTWDGVSIAGIKTNEQRELSSSYRYDADMTPGEYNGVRYDGVMRNIRGNHVALVESGRAGPDVFVSDSQPIIRNTQEIRHMARARTSRQALLASGALSGYLRSRLAADAKVDITPALKGVTSKNWKAEKPRIAERLKPIVAGKLAQDADIEDVVEMLDKLEDVTDELPGSAVVTAPTDTADDTDDEVVERLKAALKAAGKTDEEIAAIVAGSKPAEAMPAAAADKERPDTVTQAAMDAAIAAASTKAARDAEQATVARLRAIQVAERDVRPFIGELAVAQDSAPAVYKLALDSIGVDLTTVPPEAYGAVLKALPKPNAQRQTATPVAMDAAALSERDKRFPHANRLSAH